LRPVPADEDMSAGSTETTLAVDAERDRIIAEAQAMARDIVAEAERAAQDIMARAVKIKDEADRVLDDAKNKAVSLQRRAEATPALAEKIAEGRRLIDALTG
jgi:vacuolar-type H+-ATPase subunit H